MLVCLHLHFKLFAWRSLSNMDFAWSSVFSFSFACRPLCSVCIPFECMFMGKKNLFPHLSQVKSDFIDAFSNAEKQVSDYQSRLEALNNNFCKVGAFLNKMFQYIAYHRFYFFSFPKVFVLMVLTVRCCKSVWYKSYLFLQAELLLQIFIPNTLLLLHKYSKILYLSLIGLSKDVIWWYGNCVLLFFPKQWQS